MAKILSNEDGNLSNSARVVRERDYSDVDLSLDARTAPTYTSGDGDILRKLDAASVKQAIKTLLLTNRFEKPYKPQFGGDLGGLLFELMDENTADLMIAQIRASIERFEPRVKVLSLKIVATPDYNSVSVVIEFRVINSQVSDTLRVKITDTPSVAPVVLPVTPTPEPDEIILSEAGQRLVTFDNLLLRADELGILSGSILKPEDEGQLLTQNELILLVEQS